MPAQPPQLPRELKVVNVGLELFGRAVQEQGAAVVQVQWRPPGSQDPRVLELLRRLGG